MSYCQGHSSTSLQDLTQDHWGTEVCAVHHTFRDGIFPCHGDSMEVLLVHVILEYNQAVGLEKEGEEIA